MMLLLTGKLDQQAAVTKTLVSWSWRMRRKVSWSFRTWSYGPGTEGECSKKELGDKGMSGRVLSKELEAFYDRNMFCGPEFNKYPVFSS